MEIDLIKLNGYYGDIYVNPSRIATLINDMVMTSIHFSGYEDDFVMVKDTPEQIIEKIKALHGSGV